jgi:methyl-accepting chemotaxis protein
MKIKTKLALLLCVVIATVTLLIAVVYSRTTSLVAGMANTNADNSVKYLAQLVDLYVAGIENIPQNAMPGVRNQFWGDGTVDNQRLQAMLADLLASNERDNVLDVYVGIENDGKLISGEGWEAPPDYDSRTRDWYKAAVEKGSRDGGALVEPYADPEAGQVVITVSFPIYASGTDRLYGVIATDLIIEGLASKIRSATVLGSGFGILISPSGLIVEHPDKAFVTAENITKESSKIEAPLAAIGRKMTSGGSGYDDYSMGGDMRRIYYGQSESGYIPAIVYPHSEMNRLVRGVTTIQIIGGCVAIVILIVIMLFMIPSITKPLRTVQKTLERMAALDLTPDAETARLAERLGARTELGAMVESLSNVSDVFTEVLESVRGGVEQLASSSGMLDELSQNASNEVDNSKSAAYNVENLASEALRAVEATANAVTEVSQAASMTAASATRGAEASSVTSRLSEEVSGMVSGFVSELQNVGDASMENSKGMTEVGASVAAIGEFVTSIRNIASQTNLLALNAAIEAARAGDAGRGFAVVADEVRKLAEESNVASRHVSEMMEKLEAGTKNAIASSRDAASIIAEIIDRARATQESLKNATSEIDKVNDAVQAIAASAQEQAASSNEIAESSSQAKESIGNVAREISSVSNAAAVTHEAMQKVTQEAANLSSISSDLEQLLARFTISEVKSLKAEQPKKLLPAGAK